MPISRFTLGVLAALPWILSPLSARAAYPLLTEDTGTQGRGNFQAELTNEHFTIEEEEDARKQKLALTTLAITYGVLDSVDMIVSVPYLKLGASESNGTPGTQGMGDLGLDLKWRFYEEGKLSVAIKSGLTFPTGDDVLNLGAGRHTWSAYIVSTYALDQWAFHLHLGHFHFSNELNARVNIWHASAAVERKLTDDLRIVIDMGVDTNTDTEADKELVFLITGLIYSPRPNLDLDVGYKIEGTDSLSASALLTGITLRW